MVFIELLLSAHLSFKDSQLKQMACDGCPKETEQNLWLLFSCLSANSFAWLKKILFGKFPFSEPVSTKCRLRTKTVDWHSSVHTDHKILDIEAHNEDKCTTNKMAHSSFDPRNLYGRDSLTDRLLLHRDFHSWFNFATESFMNKENE